MLAARKETNLPLAEGLDFASDLPHTITSAILYKMRLESFGELPKDKRPPRYMWDRPFELSEYLDHVWDRDEDSGRNKDHYEINFEDAE